LLGIADDTPLIHDVDGSNDAPFIRFAGAVFRRDRASLIHQQGETESQLIAVFLMRSDPCGIDAEDLSVQLPESLDVIPEG
jgi:hypothetical protein